ncbi:response regulator transcription factor [Pseudoduganella umbonata]|uniref:DNA-binding NarL/FixJ family response regulator n=1 Tax=Pseudoduganella umbonata TaxID=864828 RepID=A0A4P8HU71_9BURK|nr:response regulator transcription factor [Pseudoduganella umbonata]MBB3220532.1 DNA-binding NarL/FixJ family response regulator [Pseudoduganella umbonata]QCP11955.1 response regulator transcription factor [Pseudoduganella umbonata]
MSTNLISVLVVDDHPLFRQGLTSILEGEEGISIVAEANTGREALARCHLLKPDVVIMDIQMPEMNGIEATALIRRDCPATRVIVLTTFEGDVHAMRAIKAGAAGYMLKSKVSEDLANAIRTVHGGGRCIAPLVAVAMADHMHADALSQREVQVLELAAFGKTNKLIGIQLGISESTVKVHMKSILAKMDANDRTHAVMLAVERGIIDLRQRSR